MIHQSQNSRLTTQEQNLKPVREKQQTTFKGKLIRITADLTPGQLMC